MTLSTTASRVSYPGAASVGPFAIPFRVLDDEDLLVTKQNNTTFGETTLTLGTDYTVDGVGDATATLTLSVALATGYTLVIRRDPALTQETSFANQASYYGRTHETALDRLEMQLQALQDRIDRSFGLPETFDPSLHELLVRGETGKVLGWASTSELTNLTLDSSAVALPGQGRTTATLTALLANNIGVVFNVKDYGAAGDGSTDDTDAVQATYDAARTYATTIAGRNRACVVYFPQGVYLVTTSIDATGADAFFIHTRGEGRRISVIMGTSAIGNYPILDCTNSNGSQISGLSVWAADSETCYIGILQSRQGSGSSGTHRLVDVEVYGEFTKSCVYRCSAEETTYFDLWCTNTLAGGRALSIVDVPETGIASLYAAIGTPSGGNTVHRIIGGRYVVEGVNASNRSIYIRSSRAVSITASPYCNAGTTDACVDAVMTQSLIQTLTVEGSPTACIKLGDTSDDVAIMSCQLGTAVGNIGVSIALGATVKQLMIAGCSGSGTYVLNCQGTLKNSDINQGARAAIVVTSQNNIFHFSGPASNLVRTTITNDHIFTDEAPVFIAPTLLNSWVDFGAPYSTAGYMKDSQARVHLKGTIKSGTATASTVLFTLPAGYRPAERQDFAIVSNSLFGQISIATNGDVMILVGANPSLTLNGVSFQCA